MQETKDKEKIMRESWGKVHLPLEEQEQELPDRR